MFIRDSPVKKVAKVDARTRFEMLLDVDI